LTTPGVDSAPHITASMIAAKENAPQINLGKCVVNLPTTPDLAIDSTFIGVKSQNT
jgi:hypothetical protein